MKVYLVFVCVCSFVGGDLVAPFIKPCHQDDAACMRQSAQAAVTVLAAGVPALGIETLDPMDIGKVSANNAGLKMDFRNTVVKGLRNCHVDTLKRNKSNRFYLELLCSITMKGDYTLGGQLIIMPIEGDGKYKIKIRDIQVKVWFGVTEKEVNGVRYWLAGEQWRHETDVKTSVHYNFQNLFNGNKQLSDAVQQFANSNWKEIFQEVAPPIIDAIITKIYNETTKVFTNVPVSQLSLD